MDDAAQHFIDIYDPIANLFQEMFQPEQCEAVTLAARAKSTTANVITAMEHTRSHDGSSTAKIGFEYTGKVANSEYQVETSLHTEGTSEISCNITEPFGMGGLTLEMGTTLDGRAVPEDDSYRIGWVHKGKHLTTSCSATQGSDPDGGLEIASAATYVKNRFMVGVDACYDGGAGLLSRWGFAISHTLPDLCIGFRVGGTGGEATERRNTSFEAGFRHETTPRLRIGGQFQKSSPTDSHITVAAEYDVEENVKMKATASTQGVYGLAISVLLAAHITATISTQRVHSGSSKSGSGGLSLEFNNADEGDD